MHDRVAAFEWTLIQDMLWQCEGDTRIAAKRLGVSVNMLMTRLSRHRREVAESESQPLAWIVRRVGRRFQLEAEWTVEGLTEAMQKAKGLQAVVRSDQLAVTIVDALNYTLRNDESSQRQRLAHAEKRFKKAV